MSSIRSALESYCNDELDWQQLVERLRGVAAAGEVSPSALEAAIDAAARERIITPVIAIDLKQACAAPSSSSGAKRDIAGQDETVLHGRAGESAAHASGSPLPDATVVRRVPAEAEANAAAEKTEKIAQGPATVQLQTGSPKSELPWATDSSTSSSGVNIGMMLNGRFRLEGVLGEGGMGVVFKALDERRREAGDRNLHVAVKVLGNEFKRHPQALVALQREAGKAQSLAHPNIVTVYDFDRDGAIVYMTMELLDGEPISRIIARNAKNGGMPYEDALPIVRGMAAALKHAHQMKIVHSDFKPSNVFVTAAGIVKVLDFGIARAVWTTGSAKPETIFDVQELGALTPAYASPEMLLGIEPDPRDDVYALACVTYKLLSGLHPFEHTPAHQAMHAAMPVKPIPGLKRRQMAALRHALAFRREDRTPSVEEFIRELELPEFFNRRRRRAAAVLGAIALGIASYGAWYASQGCERVNEAFVSSLMAGNDQLSAQAGTPREAELRRTFTLSVDGGLRILGDHDSPDTFNAGLLAENSDYSAYGLLTQALAIDRGSEEAARGILSIVELFVADARRLFEAGNLDEARQRIATGLEIFPQHCALNRLSAQIP